MKKTMFSFQCPEPESEYLFKWVGPLYTSKTVLISLKEKIIYIESLNDAKKYRIGTILEDMIELLLKSSVLENNLEDVSEIGQNIKKILSDRIDLIAYSEKEFNDYLKNNNISTDKFKTQLVYSESGSYYAFHKDTSDLLIKKYQKALDSLKDELKIILKKYKMD